MHMRANAHVPSTICIRTRLYEYGNVSVPCDTFRRMLHAVASKSGPCPKQIGVYELPQDTPEPPLL